MARNVLMHCCRSGVESCVEAEYADVLQVLLDEVDAKVSRFDVEASLLEEWLFGVECFL